MAVLDDDALTAEQGFEADDELDEFDLDLTCPTCGGDLIEDELFRSHRVCSSCRRHFWMPVRERLELLLDPGSFVESNEELVSIEPLVFHDRLPVVDRLAEARERPGISEAAITGIGTIGGEPAIVVALDLAVIGSNVGILAGEKIALAMEAALARRLPLVALCSGTNGRGFDGVLSLLQLARLASLAGRLHLAGSPFISIAMHPTSGNVHLGFANQADVIFAEPGAHVGFEGSHRTGESAESLLDRGEIDGVIDRSRLRDELTTLLSLLSKRGVTRPRPSEPMSKSQSARPWEEIKLSRHHDRPQARDYARQLAPSFIPLHGDRIATDDASIAIGIGRIDGVSAGFISVNRDCGPLTAGAYRKASRLLRFATHLELPVVVLADPPLDEAGAAVATASLALSTLLGNMAQAPIPVVSVILGVASGPAAFPFAVADRVLMQEHAALSMGLIETTATARDCVRWGIANEIVSEPEGGAHHDLTVAANQVEIAVSNALAELSGMGQRRLLDERARRMRALGTASAEIRESVNVEIRELQEWQKLVARSFEDLRQRWEQRPASLPNFTGKPAMPHFPGKMNLPAISLPKFTFKKPDFTEFAGRVSANRRTAAHRSDSVSDDEPV